mmetsp:Transcript_38771/g.82745  ORF Transcript_38771/g.82745 Transcript_38771/m.82745 type:complete len:239 (-) Transcript_38771:171-887(-)
MLSSFFCEDVVKRVIDRNRRSVMCRVRPVTVAVRIVRWVGRRHLSGLHLGHRLAACIAALLDDIVQSGSRRPAVAVRGQAGNQHPSQPRPRHRGSLPRPPLGLSLLLQLLLPEQSLSLLHLPLRGPKARPDSSHPPTSLPRRSFSIGGSRFRGNAACGGRFYFRVTLIPSGAAIHLLPGCRAPGGAKTVESPSSSGPLTEGFVTVVLGRRIWRSITGGRLVLFLGGAVVQRPLSSVTL